MKYPTYTPVYEPLDNLKAIVMYLRWLNRLRGWRVRV